MFDTFLDTFIFWAIVIILFNFFKHTRSWGCLLSCAFVVSLVFAFKYYEPMDLYLKISIAVFIASVLIHSIIYVLSSKKYLRIQLMDKDLISSNKESLLIFMRIEKIISTLFRVIIWSAIICMCVFGKWYYSIIATWILTVIDSLLLGWNTSLLNRH